MRRALVPVVLAVLVALAGCSTYGVQLGVTVHDVSQTPEAYQATVELDASAPEGHTLSDPRIVGLAADGSVVCTAEFEDYKPNAFQFSPPKQTIACDRFPIAFVPVTQDAPLSAVGSTPSSETTSPGAPPAGTPVPTLTAVGGFQRSAAAFVHYNASTGYLYEPTDEDPVPYAKCRMREVNANVSVIRGPTPWMNWSLRRPQTNRTYTLTVEQETDLYTDDEPDDLRPVNNPGGEAGQILKRAVVRGLDAPEDAATVRLTREEFFTLHRGLYGQPVTHLSDLPHGDHAEPRARAWRSDHRTIACPGGTYAGDKKVTVAYAVRAGGEVWEAELQYRERWSGDAYRGDE